LDLEQLAPISRAQGSPERLAGDDRTKQLFFKYRAELRWSVPWGAEDRELSAATLRQNPQMTARAGNLAKDWRIFRANGRAEAVLKQTGSR
jgi:hypothetical protein